MRFLAFFLFSIQCAVAAMSPLARDMLVPQLADKSYAEAKVILEQHEASLVARVDPSARIPMRTGYTRYKLQEAKTPFVFVVIHGLFRNPGQFRHLYSMIEGYQQNVIYMNLPGHGMDMYAAGKVRQSDWVSSMRRAAAGAMALGDKIIFLTQSTGGALSLIHTLDHPETVAGLFMIEPAIRVNNLISTLTCLAHPVMPSVNWIYRFAGREDDLSQLPYMGTRMGCEAGRLMRHYLRDNSQQDSRTQRETEIFARVNVPVIIFNNMADQIVSPRAIQRFANTVTGPKFYVEIPRETASYHADEEFMFGIIQQQQAAVTSFFQAVGL